MMVDLEDVQRAVVSAVEDQGFDVGPDAFKPLSRIDFKRLVSIHDHEERFLFEVFITSLITAHRVRREDSGGPPMIDARDVRTALLMLGSAVANASEGAFSSVNKSVITDVCPYC
jgi:hypothetical protein